MGTAKKFNCKNEEVVVICDYVQTSMERDLTDFTAYSPKFNTEYLAEFKEKNEAMNKLIFPQEKTKELKIITARLYASMDKLLDAVLRLEGYIKLAKDFVPLSANDFGITAIKQAIRGRDAEGTLKWLQQINSNIEKYQEPLANQGLNNEMVNYFSGAFSEIDADNQKQYEIVSARRILAAENVNLLNALYEQLMEICEIGYYTEKQRKKNFQTIHFPI
ncbi:MAG: hypothetical protein FWH36_07610 [Lentimicrobiaceae bacterium]|nr:hypothetical protein [Lentimicrobiaceae bacterium]